MLPPLLGQEKWDHRNEEVLPVEEGRGGSQLYLNGKFDLEPQGTRP